MIFQHFTAFRWGGSFGPQLVFANGTDGLGSEAFATGTGEDQEKAPMVFWGLVAQELLIGAASPEGQR